MFADEAYNIAAKSISKNMVANDDRWLSHEPEGQLSVDVFETDKNITITAPIAGVKPPDLEIYVSQDLVTIRGKREDCVEEKNRDYLYQECHWGRFSRSIILPVNVSNESAEAVLKNGVLTITLPKLTGSQFIPISEVEDE